MRMKTYRGHWIDLAKREVSCIDIVDIAHSLSMQNRFNGHTVQPYSVAQHSILVSQMGPSGCALWGLLHDAAEAYTGDIIRPIKECMPEFWQLEGALLEKVAATFGLSTSQPPLEVREADNRMLATEMQSPAVYNHPEVVPLGAEHAQPYEGLVIKPYKTPGEAERKFLRRFDQLYKAKKG